MILVVIVVVNFTIVLLSIAVGVVEIDFFDVFGDNHPKFAPGEELLRAHSGVTFSNNIYMKPEVRTRNETILN